MAVQAAVVLALLVQLRHSCGGAEEEKKKGGNVSHALQDKVGGGGRGLLLEISR